MLSGMPWREVLTWSIALTFVLLNWAYWWAVVTRWQTRFRQYCERRYGVTIDPGPRGYWRVSGVRWSLRNFGIEQLQFLYFMAAITCWSLAALVVIGSLYLLNP